MSMSRVLELEEQAKNIAAKWPGYDSDVKCWYNPRCLFEQQADRVFIGINPRDEPESRYGEDHSYLDFDCGGEVYNEWIDGNWPGSGTDHQNKVRRVYETLYGRADWEDKLRATPSFNVCPLRTHGAQDIPERVWAESLSWCRDVLIHLRPKTIICNGSQESGKSPWAAIKSVFTISETRRTKVQTAYLKIGKINSGPLAGTDVVGLPQLTRFGNRPLMHALRDVDVA